MEKTIIKLKCPRCGKRLSAAVPQGTNIDKARVRCAAEGCGYAGRGSDFMLGKHDLPLLHDTHNLCPKCGATWKTSYGSKEIVTCPKCGNTEKIIKIV